LFHVAYSFPTKVSKSAEKTILVQIILVKIWLIEGFLVILQCNLTKVKRSRAQKMVPFPVSDGGFSRLPVAF
jgi:hypothetical protein